MTRVNCHAGKCPQFDVDDLALVERMLTIPHRARFQNEVSTEPYTYPVDTDLKLKFPAWRPYMLRFMLEGLVIYHQEGFRNIPSTCQTFKEMLVADKDVIREFLDQALDVAPLSDKEAVAAKAWVCVKDLYNDFDASHKAMQRDKKTKKDLKAFQVAVCRCFPHYYRDKVNYYTDRGTRTSANRVLLGVKRKL